MAASAVNPASLIHPSRIPNRWVQLVAGIVAMMAIANPIRLDSLHQADTGPSARFTGSCPVDHRVIRRPGNLAGTI